MSRFQGTRPVRKLEYWLVLCSVALVSVCYYGLRAAAVCGLAAACAVLTDFICLFLRGRSYKLVDLSNIGTAIILVLMFPATVPYSIVLLSTVFAVAVGTHVFGYRKDHLFPPAAVGYLFALLNWKQEILQFPRTGVRLALFGNDVTLSLSVSAVMNSTGRVPASGFEMLLGTVSTPMGTGCLLMLLVGFWVLLLRRQISAWAAFGFYGGIVLTVLLTGYPMYGMLTGNMILFAMVFLTADTSVMPCRSVLAFPAALVTGILTTYFVMQFHLEYAPVIAVMLTAPLWRGFGALEKRLTAPAQEPEEEVTADA